MTKEDIAIADEYLDADIISLLDGTYEGKKLFYMFIKKWHWFLYSIHKEDRLILLKMVLDVYSYDECTMNIINIQDLQSNIDYFFFSC